MEQTPQSNIQDDKPQKFKLKKLPNIPTEIITMVGNWCIIISVIISYVPMHSWLLSSYFWPIWLIGVLLSAVQTMITKNKISGIVGIAVSIFALVKYL